MSVKSAARSIFMALGCLFFWCSAGFPSDLLILGEGKLLQGKLNEAEHYLVKALEENPADYRALSSLGRVYFHRALYRQAEDKFLLSMAQFPPEEWVKCWNNLYLGRIDIINGALENASLKFGEASGRRATANCRSEAEKYLAYIDVLEFSRKSITEEVKTACCVIHYAKDDVSPENAITMAGLAEGYFEKIERLLDISFKNGPIHIYLYPSTHQYRLWAARELLAGRLADGEIHVFHWDGVDHGHLEHEMVHVMTGPRLEGRVPIDLLNEGMAEFVVGDLWGLPVDAWVKGIRENGYYVPITTLAGSNAFRAANPILSYTQAGAFVKFLVDRFGTEKLFHVAAGESSWQSAYGMSLAELEMQWLADLDALASKPVDTGLLNYRLSLGDRYRTAGFSSEGLPWVGVTYEVIGDGLVITDVMRNSPALEAGLRVGDSIRKIDGVPVNACNSWLPAATVHQKEIGDAVSLVVERGSVEELYMVTLGSEPDQHKRQQYENNPRKIH